MHQSVATIDSPEFLNLQPLDINPLMSKCEIKVFYVGENRNHSFISEEVAAEMGKTLRGAPIVGYYRTEKEDFRDHGEKIIIDDEGVKFQCQTVPYGFVSPDAEVWFQNFEDSDSMGNKVTHRYLMTTGYLWTGQFPESSLPVNNGRPQSMELDEETLQGNWETNLATGLDFFIINDAIISKICILGDDVEPCFEGASVTAPNVSKNFTLDDKFRHTLFSMMQDLKSALSGGGQQMKDKEPTAEVGQVEVEAVTETEFTETSEEVSADSVENLEGTTPTGYAKEEEEEEETPEGDSEDEEEEEEDKDEDAKKEYAEKYAALEESFISLQEKYQTLQSYCDELVSFKRTIDNQQKDSLIAEFYMLSDDDKAEVIQNKEKYSLEDIKAKLSVICFDKKIGFAPESKSDEHDESTSSMTYVLSDEEKSSLPDWVKAVKEQEKLG